MRTYTFELADKWLAWMRKRRFSERTIESYPVDVEAFFAFSKVSPEDAKRHHFDDWTDALHTSGLAPRTISRRVASCSSYFYFRRYREPGVFTNNPTEGLELPEAAKKNPDHMEMEQVKSLLDFKPFTFKDVRASVFFWLLYSNGPRISEVVGLNAGDINLETGVIVIRHGKGDKERQVILTAPALEKVKAWLILYPKKPNEPLFHNRCGERISASGLRADFKRIAAARGISRRVWPHLVRHTYATHGLDNGMGLEDIQKNLGHSSMNTTLIYAHVTENKAREAQKKHPMNNMTTDPN